MRRHLRGALQRLQTAYLDLYLLHVPRPAEVGRGLSGGLGGGGFGGGRRSAEDAHAQRASCSSLGHEWSDGTRQLLAWREMEAIGKEGRLAKHVGLSNWAVPSVDRT